MPDQELPLQLEPDQLLPLHELPLHVDPDQLEPDQLFPFHTPPDQLEAAASAVAIAAASNRCPKMS